MFIGLENCELEIQSARLCCMRASDLHTSGFASPPVIQTYHHEFSESTVPPKEVVFTVYCETEFLGSQTFVLIILPEKSSDIKN